MRVLVACEESQVVCKSFREKGHEAYSCDIEACSGGHPEWHYQQDVKLLLKQKWDIVIAHPPCTFITNASSRHLKSSVSSKNGVKAKINGLERFWHMIKACQFFKRFQDYLMDFPDAKVCIENPIPHKYAKNIIGQYTQIIQPWMFGHKETKATCLWLYNLPKLVETNNVKFEMNLLPKKEKNRIHYMSPGPERAKLRSKTFTGVGKAMAEQWG